MLRLRPVSQRKRIKKSLGPDFLDPSNIRETRDSKCTYCHSSSQSQEELVSCSKCDFKTHPSCFKNEHCFEICPSQDWLCFYCAHDCAYCKKHIQTYESISLCVECKNGYHSVCAKHSSPKNSIKGLLKGPFMCNKCSAAKSKPVKEPNGVHLPHNKLAKKLVKKEVLSEEEMDMEEEDIIEKEEDVEDEEGENLVLVSTSSKSSSRKEKDSIDWTIDDVAEFIRDSGFPEEALIFKREEIDGRSLLLLQRSDVLTGLSMKLGPALKIFARIYQLQLSRLQSLNSEQTPSESSSCGGTTKSESSKVSMNFAEQKCKSLNF